MDSSKKGMMTKRLATSKSSIFSFLHFYGAIISLSYCLQGVRTDSHQLLVYEKASKRFQLREDVLALMDPLPSPIFIISAVGNARIGKSTTMNCIQYLWNEKCDGFKQSFKTSDNQTPETRGVWMKMLSWKEQQNASVVFLDVEGTNAGDSSVIDNFSLFTGLLSSEIMAFTGKYVENHILDFFYRISKLLDGMVEYNKLETLGLPSLRVVQIGALKTCGKTQRDHVADALIKPFHDDGHDKQRESIRKYFPREKIQASKLMYLQSDSLNILEEFHLHYQTDYGKQIQKLVADLKTVLPKRTLRKSLIDGKSFVDIVKKLVNAMNTNFWEDFGNQYKAIEKQICNNAAETYLEDLQDKSASDIEKMKNERIRQFEIKCKLQEETDRRIKNVEKILLKKRELEEEVRKQVESERKRAEEEKRRKIAEEKLIEQQKEQARKVKLAEEAMAAEVRRRKEEEEKRRQVRKEATSFSSAGVLKETREQSRKEDQKMFQSCISSVYFDSKTREYFMNTN